MIQTNNYLYVVAFKQSNLISTNLSDKHNVYTVKILRPIFLNKKGFSIELIFYNEQESMGSI